MKSKIIVIVGPTATGKTSLSIELAKEYNAEIINADATGVYTEPLIATAKIKETEKQGIIHHMIDLISLNDDYSIYEYQEKGRELLNNLIKNNKNIIIVGGSGLYIKALLYDYKLDKTEQNKIDLSQFSNEKLLSIANEIDINNNIHINNRKRLERYISYYKKTGKVISKTDSINNKLYDFNLIGLKTSREELYNRINKRVEDMFNDGLLEEAKDLYNKNLKNFSNIIGYKELNMYFKNIITLEEAKELIKQNTRKYAKRQLTWFNNQMNDIVWFDVNYSNFNITIDEIKKYLKN